MTEKCSNWGSLERSANQIFFSNPFILTQHVKISLSLCVILFNSVAVQITPLVTHSAQGCSLSHLALASLILKAIMKEWGLKVEMGRGLRVVRLTGPAPLSVGPNPLCAEILRLIVIYVQSRNVALLSCVNTAAPLLYKRLVKVVKKLVKKSVILMLFYPKYVQCRGKLCAKDVHRLLFRYVCVWGREPTLTSLTSFE